MSVNIAKVISKRDSLDRLIAINIFIIMAHLWGEKGGSMSAPGVESAFADPELLDRQSSGCLTSGKRGFIGSPADLGFVVLGAEFTTSCRIRTTESGMLL